MKLIRKYNISKYACNICIFIVNANNVKVRWIIEMQNLCIVMEVNNNNINIIIKNQ